MSELVSRRDFLSGKSFRKPDASGVQQNIDHDDSPVFTDDELREQYPNEFDELPEAVKVELRKGARLNPPVIIRSPSPKSEQFCNPGIAVLPMATVVGLIRLRTRRGNVDASRQ